MRAEAGEKNLFEIAAERFGRRGFRLTEQRRAVLDAVISNREKHLSCEDVFEDIRQKRSGISRATVYRALPLLEKLGLLIRIDLNDGCVRYESCLQDEEAHCHMICLECGAILEVKEELLNVLEGRVCEKNDFAVRNRSVKFYGYCKECVSATRD